MNQEEIVITDSDDDLDLGLVITSVQSLADSVEQGTRSNDPCEQDNSVIGRIAGQQTTPIRGKRKKKETTINAKVFIPPKKSEHSVSTYYVSPDLETRSPLPSASDQSHVSTPLNCLEVGKGQDLELSQMIQSCIVAWKSIFPWVLFNESSFQFTCSVCQWGYKLPEYYDVYRLHNKGNLRSVAGKLKVHSRKKYHEIVEREQKLVISLCNKIYSVVKNEIFNVTDIECFKNMIPDLICYTLPEGESMIYTVLHNLAVSIEESYLDSLRESPYFSVVTMSEEIIVRWIAADNEVVEHIFLGAVQARAKKLHMLEYLKYKGIDMTRMVSHSNFTVPTKELAGLDVNVKNVADRCCPMDSLLKWLKHTKSLQDLFKHLEALAWVYSTSGKCDLLGRFCGFTKDNADNVFKCLKKEGALYSIFVNHLSLDKVMSGYPDMKECNELDFKKLYNKRNNPVIRTVCSLAKLNSLVDKYDSIKFVEELECYQKNVRSAGSELINVYKKLGNNASLDSEKDIFALSLIALYLDNLNQAKVTQSQGDIAFFDGLFKLMKDIRFDDIESVFSVLMKDLSDGKGFHQLLQLHMLFGRDKNASPMKLLGILHEHPEQADRFPNLLKLGQILMVIPTLNAHVERYFFDVVVAERFFKGKVSDSVLQLLVYVYLEGPNSEEELNMEKILQYYV